MKNIELFKNKKYGLMIHFGLYSALGGIYKGNRSGNYAEWIQSYFRIPNEEMEKIASEFNPVDFNADEIVKFAYENGFKYIVFTAKHHDGFAMFKSEVDDYNIYTYTGRDLLNELSLACKKYDVKLGVYYSQDLDWHECNGGGYKSPIIDCAGTSWCNDWDFNSNNKNFDEYFYRKSLPQIEELMTNYDDIFVAWFDVPYTLSKKQSNEIYKLVKKYNPDCFVNSRLGNGEYDYVNFGDNEVPNSKEELDIINSNNNDINGIKKSPYGLYEVCLTLNQSWGYTKNPKWKDVEQMKYIKRKVEDLGINLLVNIGPDENGKIEDDAKYMISEIMKK